MDKKANGKANLHFHGFFLLEEGKTTKELRQQLKLVFGDLLKLGPHQFALKAPAPEKRHSFADRKAHGVTGKLHYVLTHMGTTYNLLELNEGGKRSRKAPEFRRIYNRNGKGLARGIPSNFAASAVICDNKAKQMGKEAFTNWIVYHQAANTDVQEDTPIENQIGAI